MIVPEVTTERVAMITFLLCNGRRFRTAEIAQFLGLSRQGAYAQLSRMARVLPLVLADWWTRYIVPPGGTVLDPFNGAGTMGVAALRNGCNYIGIEKMAKYIDVSHERLAKVQPALMEIA